MRRRLQSTHDEVAESEAMVSKHAFRKLRCQRRPDERDIRMRQAGCDVLTI